jgi:hypothetical protein
VTDSKQVEGMEATTRAVAAGKAADAGHKGATAEEGPWLLTLDYSTYSGVVQFAKDRELRRRFWLAYRNIAANGTAADNTAIINQMLAGRQELARILNFTNYGTLAMEGKVRARAVWGGGCVAGGAGISARACAASAARAHAWCAACCCSPTQAACVRTRPNHHPRAARRADGHAGERQRAHGGADGRGTPHGAARGRRDARVCTQGVRQRQPAADVVGQCVLVGAHEGGAV